MNEHVSARENFRPGSLAAPTRHLIHFVAQAGDRQAVLMEFADSIRAQEAAVQIDVNAPGINPKSGTPPAWTS